MIKSLAIRYAKKYAVKAINDLLQKNKECTAKVCIQVSTWTTRLNLITNYLSKISARAADGVLDDEEVQSSLTELDSLIKEF